MPEYLPPGVYVEEGSFRSKPIEGVSTTTTGFIGPARYGPVDLTPDLVTSLGDFERVYGDGRQLEFAGLEPVDNYLWHAVRSFFEEGGQRLYISRVFLKKEVKLEDLASVKGYVHTVDSKTFDMGVGYARLPKNASTVGPSADFETWYPTAVHVRARFPGILGNLRVQLTLHLGQNLVGYNPETCKATLSALLPFDIVWVNDLGSPMAPFNPTSSPPGTVPVSGGSFYQSRYENDPVTGKPTWFFYSANGGIAFSAVQLSADPNPALCDQVRVVTARLTVLPSSPDGLPQVWTDLPLDPAHQDQSGLKNALNEVFAIHPANRSMEYRLPLVITLGDNIKSGLDVLTAIFNAGLALSTPVDLATKLQTAGSTESELTFEFMMEGGNDGSRPGSGEYDGIYNPANNLKTGLKLFEDIDDISIVAAPGSTFGLNSDAYRKDASAIIGLLIAHAERMRYRIAVLDSSDGMSVSDIRAVRARMDSKHAALYYPWVRVIDPITHKEIVLPPSSFVSGIYARNDITRGVYKAPANEVVRLAIGFETLLNKGQQDVLNTEGINCFRYFEGRGFSLWGARTISSDPEWKYVNLRRYFAYLEHSVDKGTQWVVFEPNSDTLWADVRRTIEDFLLNEWQNGALLGDKPEKAFFVRCDRSTMTQNDLDNGRLVCLIGVALLRPAEFVFFRIGQWTADANRNSISNGGTHGCIS